MLINQLIAWMFSLYVTLLWTEKPISVGHNGKTGAPKPHNLTKNHPKSILLLTYTHAEFIHQILMVHGIHHCFQAHPQSGPDFWICWKGSVYIFPPLSGCSFYGCKIRSFLTLSLKTFTHFTFPLELIRQTPLSLPSFPFILQTQHQLWVITNCFRIHSGVC